MNKMLSESQLNFVNEKIQVELLKRGITAKIIKCEETEHGVEIQTESFQTFPVMFKKVYVYSHLSGFSDTDKDAVEIYIGLSFRYISFTGGSNGTDLMDVRFKFVQGSDIIVKI